MTQVQTIGNYEIKREIGRGGMGVVYEGYDKRLDRIVAIKVIDTLSLDTNISEEQKNELIQRFKIEAKAIAKLTHPNIVSVYDVGEENGKYYMVMEFLKGRSFQQLISLNSPLNLELVLKSMIQVCEALEFAHQNGIIHRDIKPANIILLDNGVTKLMDFGIARLEASQSGLTKAGTILGSLLYISPEQLISAQKVDRRADIYSLGVSIYEMLTGKVPYTANNIGEIVMQIMQAEPLRPSQLNPSIPQELDFIIFKAIAKDPNNRFERAKDLADALNNVLMEVMYSNTQYKKSTTGPLNIKSETKELPAVNTSMSSASKTMFPLSEKLEFSLVQGVDEINIYSTVYRVIQSWHVENLGAKPLLELIYKEEGRSWVLLVNNNVLLFIYKGLIIGAVSNSPLNTGSKAYEVIGLASNFEIKAFLPPTNSESWIILLASILGGSKLVDKKPACYPNDCTSIMDLLKKEEFTGYMKVISNKSTLYNFFLDGDNIFSITVPNPENNSLDSTLLDIEIYKVKIKLIGPSLRRLLIDTSIEVITKTPSRPSLKQLLSFKNKEITPTLLEEAIRNTDIPVILSSDTSYSIGKKTIKLSEIIKESDHYRVLSWFIYDLLYSISRSSKFEQLKNVFKFIWQIKSNNFLQNIKVDSISLELDLVSRDPNDKFIFGAKILNNVTVNNFNKLINDLVSIKKNFIKNKQDNFMAFTIVSNEFNFEIINYFNKLTSKPFPSGLWDFSNVKRGFVKVSGNKGFYLYLLQDIDTAFKLVAPENLMSMLHN